jgi:hypothetical protein
MDKFIKV